MSVSILILTLDEEQNLPHCLESLRWCDDVVVLDSCSTDRTEEIARAAGARFIQHRFDGFAAQRNYAIRGIPFKHPWVFHLDADECFTPELHSECLQVTVEDAYSGFLVSSKMMLGTRWLRHAATFPVYQTRLIKLGEVCFAQCGHGQREVDATRGIGKLREPYLHHSFSKGFGEWFERHNRYSTEEARQTVESLSGSGVDWRGLVCRDAVRRRRALKGLSFRLPFRPWLKFLYMYVLRMGFLDGGPGLTYCTLQAIYEYMICLKIRELQRGKKATRQAQT